MPDFAAAVTVAEHRRLKEFLDALRTPCRVTTNPASTLVSSDFEQEFRSKLLTHHCFMGSPLFQESFDSAFVAACRHAGIQVEIPSTGQRFWDISLDGRKVSLKSTKAKDLRVGRLFISKLTEAAWIQDCRTAAKRQEHTFDLFRTYCAEVESIFQLRYFVKANLYELVEIPVSMFQQILSIGKKHFSSDGPTIDIPIGKEPPDFTLRLDRSDAKITIANIDKELCTVHATWQL